jgi:hypothetical protein
MKLNNLKVSKFLFKNIKTDLKEYFLKIIWENNQDLKLDK